MSLLEQALQRPRGTILRIEMGITGRRGAFNSSCSQPSMKVVRSLVCPEGCEKMWREYQLREFKTFALDELLFPLDQILISGAMRECSNNVRPSYCP